MNETPFALTHLYENALTIVRGSETGGERYLLTAWTRAYYVELHGAGGLEGMTGRLVILYAGVRENVPGDGDGFAEIFWKRTAWTEGHPEVVRVASINGAIEKAVEHAQSWPYLVWDELLAFPRGIAKAPRLAWSPDDAAKKRHDAIRTHLESLGDRPKIERHAAVCMIERLQSDFVAGEGPKNMRKELLCVWNRRYHCWLMPGGRVETTDFEKGTVETGGYRYAAARELHEETGMAGEVGAEVYCASLVPRPEHEDRASVVHIFRTSIGDAAQPHETEPGCPVTWMTRTEFLRGCAFADFYIEAFAAIDRKDKAAAELPASVEGDVEKLAKMIGSKGGAS